MFYILLLGLLAYHPLAVLSSYMPAVQNVSHTPTPVVLEDAFLKPPPNLQNREPGDILAIRELPVNSTFAQNASAIYQFVYRSTDGVGNASANVVTVWLPKPETLNGDRTRHVAFSLPYDSASANCGPSYEVQVNALKAFEGLTTKPELGQLDALLAEGFYVSSSDYEGPLGSYTHGLQAGRSVLDSIRAVIKSSRLTGISPEARTIMWGYSGGSISNEWAAELQSSYAPELLIVGAALGGLIPNLNDTTLTVNGTSFAGLVPAGILGLASQEPEFAAYLNETLVPAKFESFYAAQNQCIESNLPFYNNTNLSAYFTNGVDFLSAPEVMSTLNRVALMGQHSVPRFPMLVFKAIADEISPVENTDALVQQLCDDGAKIRYLRDNGTNHPELEFAATKTVITWISDLFDQGVGILECVTIETDLSNKTATAN